MRPLFQSLKIVVGPALRSVVYEPTISEALWPEIAIDRARCFDISMAGDGAQSNELLRRRQVEAEGSSGFPVGRNLQDRRAAESAMSDQHFLAELLLADGGDNFGGDSAKVAVTLAIFCGQDEGHQC